MLLLAAGLVLFLGAACNPGGYEAVPTPRPPEVNETMDWSITSSAFSDGERIPIQHTGEGENLSPPLSWTEPPAETVELLLICDDPDAPSGTFTHWLAWGMDPDVRELPEGVPTTETVASPALVQGTNSAGKVGYYGPLPPPGPEHRYQFYLYALTEASELEPGADKAAVAAQVEAKSQATCMLEGLYSR
jgi:hypothetical protein